MLSCQVVLFICCISFASSNQPGDLPKEPVGNHTQSAVATILRKGLMPTVSQDEDAQGREPIVIPLTRQLVPVKSKITNNIVSYKSAYFGTIHLGTEKSQEFSVVFDTGSSQVIIPSWKCESSACTMHRRFNTKDSKSARDIDADGTEVVDTQGARDQVVVGFGTGEVHGEFVKDTVCLGPELYGGSARCANDLKMISAIQMSDTPFASFNFDGVVGLGLPEGALDPSFSLLHMLSSNPYGLHRSHVGIFLSDSGGGSGEISFGGVNSKRLKSPIQWTKVISPNHGHWQIPVKAIKVDGVAVDICSDGECKAIVDTGSSHLGVPTSIHASLQNSLSSMHPWQSLDDCRNSQGPELELDLGEFSLTLSTRQYIKRLPQPAHNTSGWFGSPKESFCRPQIMKLGLQPPLGPNLFLLGEPVLRKYYTTFDWVEKRVGFALSSQDLEEQDEVISLVQVRVKLHRSPTKVRFGVEMSLRMLSSGPLLGSEDCTFHSSRPSMSGIVVPSGLLS